MVGLVLLKNELIPCSLWIHWVISALFTFASHESAIADIQVAVGGWGWWLLNGSWYSSHSHRCFYFWIFTHSWTAEGAQLLMWERWFIDQVVELCWMVLETLVVVWGPRWQEVHPKVSTQLWSGISSSSSVPGSSSMTKPVSICDDDMAEAGLGWDVGVMAEVVDGGFPVDCCQYLDSLRMDKCLPDEETTKGISPLQGSE